MFNQPNKKRDECNLIEQIDKIFNDNQVILQNILSQEKYKYINNVFYFKVHENAKYGNLNYFSNLKSIFINGDENQLNTLISNNKNIKKSIVMKEIYLLDNGNNISSIFYNKFSILVNNLSALYN